MHQSAVCLPGFQSNGGQQTRMAGWFLSALHQAGETERAWELVQKMLPCTHSATRQRAMRYQAEPYAMSASISVNSHQYGRAQSAWAEASAGGFWFHVVHDLLGFHKTGNQLRFRPVVPEAWDQIRITYQYGSATYHLHALRSCAVATSEGEELEGGVLILRDDGRIHEATFPLR